MRAVDKVPVSLRRSLIQDLEAEKPDFRDWDDWIAAKAVTYGIDEKDIRLAVAEYQDLFHIHLRIAAASEAQKVAHTLGASRAKAIQTLLRGLEAERERPMVDRQGELKGTFKAPDWDARKGCAVELLKVWGGYAPQQIEVRSGPLEELNKLTDEELHRKIRECIATVEAEGAGTPAAPGGTEGAAGGSGPALLADPMHEDQG